MVGVLDMLRFQQFTAGQFWRDEYGYVEKEDEFKALLAYSPYHNIKEGTKYPPTLIMTADTDDRVVPMHSFKFARRHAAAQAGDAPILLRIETRAGHGAGTPVTKLIENAADRWAFLVKELKMETRPEQLIASQSASLTSPPSRLRNSRGSGNDTLSCRIERGSTVASNRSRSQSRHCSTTSPVHSRRP